MPHRSTLRRKYLKTALLIGAALLAGCQTIGDGSRPDPQTTLGDALTHNRNGTSISTHTTDNPKQNTNMGANRYTVDQDITLGNGQFINPGSDFGNFGAIETMGEVELAFDNAPISQVVEEVVGRLLGANFILDPEINGNVTLKTAGKVAKSDIPSLLDQALRLSGAALVETSAGNYSVVQTNAIGRYAKRPSLYGYGGKAGIVIVPLRYVSANEMNRIISPMVPDGMNVRTDERREVLFLDGDRAQLDTILETIEMFDVDWLSQMSFGVFEARFSEPTALVEELNTIFGGVDGPIGRQVEFVPMPRRSSVLVIAKRPERLSQAEDWIRRLDVDIGGEGRRFQFLPVMNADAESVADTLSDIFSDRSSGQFGSGTNEQSDFPNSAQGPRIKAELSTNSLIVYGTDDEVRQVQTLLRDIDVLPDQVLIEAVIAEVSLNDDLRYGVQWFFDTRDGGNFTFSDAGGGSVSARFPGFAYTFSDTYVRAALSALSAVTDIEVVSSPQIVTLDNQTATLQVGDQVPVVTQSAVSVDNPNAPIVNSVQYRDTGILLTVTPRINDSDTVILEVSQEVSDAVPTVTSGIDAPTIQQRQFDSVVSIADGETLALGGLIRASKSQGNSGVPILKDVPLLGSAFSSRSDNRSRAELVIFLTPHIIRSKDDARAASEHIRSRLQRLRTSGFLDEAEEN